MNNSFLDKNQKRFVEELKEFMRIPSVSTLPEKKGEVERAAEWVSSRLQTAGIKNVKTMETRGHPIVYGDWLSAPGKPTVLFYGHYDVQPAEPFELWDYPPFDPCIKNGRIYGRGATDMKANVLLPIIACESWLLETGELPVNVKFLFEGEEEIGSPSLSEFMEQNQTLLASDLAVSADSGQMQEAEPATMVSLRGLAGVQIDVQSAEGDLHSGLYGGAVPNAIQALTNILDSMKRKDGSIAIDGFYEHVEERTKQEREDMNKNYTGGEDFKKSTGVSHIVGEPGYTIAEQTLTRPTLDVNGIWGGFQGMGVKTVIPSTAHAKVTCRLVPNQTPDEVIEKLRNHVGAHTPKEVRAKVIPLAGRAYPYMLPHDHPGLKAVEQAVQAVEKKTPAMLRIGGSIPITGLLQNQLGVHTVQLGFSVFDEGMHAPNEFYRLSQFQKGQKVYVQLLQELNNCLS
ncbi:dipeptidase [Salibacterium salarium]|uniref:Dipeptidase n=1 Tax=Salibacterium salarium TaxID=284579 RepID=A0A428N064_9BACI|nr:dipeptidase [Salibacterium salarium]RSL31702.1 dipeptidase [Salibacterium salarium]